MPSDKVSFCSEMLADNKFTIAFIESATAGRMCSEFALTSKSGDILIGGLACYDARIKQTILGIPTSLITQFTPESAEVTKAMAVAGKKLFNADFTVAVTGLTTAGGSETSEKPVGTMFLHIVTPTGNIAVREIYDKNPKEIILSIIDKTAQLLIDRLRR